MALNYLIFFPLHLNVMSLKLLCLDSKNIQILNFICDKSCSKYIFICSIHIWNTLLATTPAASFCSYWLIKRVGGLDWLLPNLQHYFGSSDIMTVPGSALCAFKKWQELLYSHLRSGGSCTYYIIKIGRAVLPAFVI
jgi:hypothetical protein